MILDSLLCFTGNSKGATGTQANGPNSDSPTTGTQACSNIIDLGLIGLPSFASGGGARDMGIGDDPTLKLLVEVVTSNSPGGTSLQMQLQGAPDNGSGAPGAFTTMWTGPAVLTANLTVGAYLANIDVPRTIPGQPIPRFLQLNMISAGTFTTGQVAIEGFIVIDRFDLPIGATGLVSSYPPGITIPN